MATQLPLPFATEDEDTAPGYMDTLQSGQIFGDLIHAVHRAFNEDDGDDETLVPYHILMMARVAIEKWYMRDGVERDLRYRREHGVR